MRPIRAEELVEAPREELFRFLADLDEHWALGGSFVRVLEIVGPAGARNGGRVQIRGPLGVSRSARTRVLEAIEPGWMMGVAEVGRQTTAAVSWSLRATGPFRTRIELRADLLHLGMFDRFLLAFGGRWWLRRLFETTLATLAAGFMPDGARAKAAAAPAPLRAGQPA